MKKFALALVASFALASCSAQARSVDQTKLVVGVPALQDGGPVSLTLAFGHSLSPSSASSSFDIMYSATRPDAAAPLASALSCSLAVPAADLFAMDGQDPGALFFDLAFWAPFASARAGLSFGLWLADPVNSLTATVSALGGLVVSSAVSISKAGIWFLSPALQDGGVPYGFDPGSDSTYQACWVVKGGLFA